MTRLDVIHIHLKSTSVFTNYDLLSDHGSLLARVYMTTDKESEYCSSQLSMKMTNKSYFLIKEESHQRVRIFTDYVSETTRAGALMTQHVAEKNQTTGT